MPSDKSAKKPKRRKSSAAPGQMYGYGVQTTRTLAHLLRAGEGDMVSVEHIDDVATVRPDGTLSEQDKSGLVTNPIADRSVELWKSLANWTRALRDGALPSNTEFVLYVAQPHQGAVADRIHSVRGSAEALALVHELRDLYWGPEPQRATRDAIPDALAAHLDYVLASTDEVVAILFERTTIEKGSGAPSDDLRPLISRAAIGEDAVEPVLEALLGWTKRTIDRQIERGQPVGIAYAEFHRAFTNAARAHDRACHILQASPPKYGAAELEGELRHRTYIRQLVAINADDDDLAEAVDQFLRAAWARTEWSDQGEVSPEHFEEFFRHLASTWKAKRQLVQLQFASSDECTRGQALFLQCKLYDCHLQGMSLPGYFVPGSFHDLAERLTIGWHPDYRSLLK